MQLMHTAYITHSVFLKHDMGPSHPESPARIRAIENQLIASNLLNRLIHYEAPAVTKTQLTRVHTSQYIERIFKLSPKTGLVELDGDTSMNPYTLDAALHAAGAAIKGVDLVMAGKVKNVFCNVRPPGHHAHRSNSAGFCIFNNVAVAAAHAIEHHGLTRVAIADFDVHHGDGTEDIFHDDPRVMLCSTFQHPFYPHSGATSGNDHMINVPLAAGATSTEFQAAVNKYWLPALERFKPQLLLISAGFDAHEQDLIGGLQLKESDYFWITEMLKKVANKYAKDRIVSMLEGGYTLDALGRSVAAHVKSLSSL